MENRQIFTRHNNEITNNFPELNFTLPKGTILDGECVKLGSDNKPNFEDLMIRFHVQNQTKIKRLSKQDPVTLCVFDVLYYKGKNICHWPLENRKELLEELIPEENQSLAKVRYIRGSGKAFFKACCEQKLEGIVLKKSNSAYQIEKRPKGVWYKCVNFSYTNVFITGLRKSRFGWLLSFDDERPAGVLELGTSLEMRRKVYKLSQSIPQKEKGDFVHFLNQSIRCRVKYRNFTKSGLLRLPSFVELIGTSTSTPDRP